MQLTAYKSASRCPLQWPTNTVTLSENVWRHIYVVLTASLRYFDAVNKV